MALDPIHPLMKHFYVARGPTHSGLLTQKSLWESANIADRAVSWECFSASVPVNLADVVLSKFAP
jgi:hypothetical protein